MDDKEQIRETLLSISELFGELQKEIEYLSNYFYDDEKDYDEEREEWMEE